MFGKEDPDRLKGTTSTYSGRGEEGRTPDGELWREDHRPEQGGREGSDGRRGKQIND